MLRFNVRLDYDEDAVEAMVRSAIVLGFKREDPRKRWTDGERKEAVRWLVKKLLSECL